MEKLKKKIKIIILFQNVIYEDGTNRLIEINLDFDLKTIIHQKFSMLENINDIFHKYIQKLEWSTIAEIFTFNHILCDGIIKLENDGTFQCECGDFWTSKKHLIEDSMILIKERSKIIKKKV